METLTTLLTLDFGSEYIRAAQTRYDSARSLELNPQILEFGGKRYLRNAVLLDSQMREIVAVGESVYQVDETARASGVLLAGLTLAGESEVSPARHALEALLTHFYQRLELDRLTPDEQTRWLTLFAVPIHSPEETTRRMTERLQAAGFPSPQGRHSALAILRYYFPTGLLPGIYLIVDCGACYTRLALCQVISPEKVRILAEKSGLPGGNDFDQALTEHFRGVLASSTVLSPDNQSELNTFVQGFKVRFLKEIARGRESYASIYPVAAADVTLQLERRDFEDTIARPLMDKFRSLGQRILDENGVSASDLQAILIAGGNAYWPFVRAWAEAVVGAEKVFLATYPEEVNVQGLSYLIEPTEVAAGPESIPPDEVSPVRIPPGPTSPEPVPEKKPIVALPQKKLANPWLAFGLEVVGGLFGVLGLGWFFIVQNMVGCATLLGWWVAIVIALVALGGVSAITFNPLPLLFFIPIWLGVPLVSGTLAYQASKRRNRASGVRK